MHALETAEAKTTRIAWHYDEVIRELWADLIAAKAEGKLELIAPLVAQLNDAIRGKARMYGLDKAIAGQDFSQHITTILNVEQLKPEEALGKLTSYLRGGQRLIALPAGDA